MLLGTGRRELRLRAHAPSRLLLLGGLPFTEQIVMWWNFVARTGDEIAASREAWQAELAAPSGSAGPARSGSLRFGTVPGFDGPALAAPAMPATPLRPRGRVR